MLVANGERLESTAQAVVARQSVPAAEVTSEYGVRCVTAERATVDEMCRVRDVREAVVVLDMAMAAGLTTVRRVREHLATRGSIKGIRVCHRALPLAREGSRSPQETRFRLIWEVDAGWSAPFVNRAVYGEGGSFIGVPDLLDPVRRVVGEYDGADHPGPSPRMTAHLLPSITGDRRHFSCDPRHLTTRSRHPARQVRAPGGCGGDASQDLRLGPC